MGGIIMAKIKNEKTGVVKEIEKEFEVSMYLATGEWKLVDEKSEKTPFVKPAETNEK